MKVLYGVFFGYIANYETKKPLWLGSSEWRGKNNGWDFCSLGGGGGVCGTDCIGPGKDLGF